MESYIGKVCPFCKTPFKDGDNIKVCNACATPHHQECWDENKGCSTFGCSEQSGNANTCLGCKNELADGEMFCPKCGLPKNPSVVQTTFSSKPKRKKHLIKNSIFFRRKKNTIITISSIAAIIIIVTAVIFSGTILFAFAYNSNNIDFAKSVQSSYKWNNMAESGIDNFLDGQNTSNYNDYNNAKISYEVATQNFTKMSNFKSFNNDKLVSLNASKQAFLTGEGLIKENKTLDAILEYKKVIAEDTNYKSAQDKIESSKTVLLTQVQDKLKSFESLKDFNGGLALIAQIDSIFPNDNSIAAKKSSFETMKKNAEIQGYKSSQKLTVVNAYTINEGNYIILRGATVVVKNNTSQVVKKYVVGILMFDSNGYPVDNSYSSLYGDGNEKKGNATSPNIQPGATYGSGQYWDIEDNATKIKACVISAEFYDGTSWTNPYYEYWLAQEKDRY